MKRVAAAGPLSAEDAARRRFLRSAAALGAVTLVGLGGCTTRSRLPNVAVLDREWSDVSRQRYVPVRLYLPEPLPPQRLPLLVFSHGIGGSREGYSYLGSYLASEGIACLHLQHVGSDRRLWWEGGPFSVVDRLQRAAAEAEALARVDDVRFALDRVSTGDLATVIDEHRIIAAGHSYGANTTLLLGGAQVERQGRPMALRDERVRAIMLISAPPFYGERTMQPILSPVRVPSLHVTATEDVIRIPGYYSDLRDRLAIFDLIGSERKSLVVYEGGSHSVFTDRNFTGGVQRNRELKRATRELALAFVREVVDADSQAISAWRDHHQRLLARFDAQNV